MANRFWVGGTASMDATAGTKWALTSGGAGGQAVPTSSDDVFFDAASGAVTVTLGASSAAKSVNFTGFTGTFAGSSAISVAGSVTLVAGMTFTNTSTWTITGTGTITFAGKTLTGLTINGSGITVTPADTIRCSNITVTQGIFDASANNPDAVITGAITSTGAATRSTKLGSGTWTLSGVSSLLVMSATAALIAGTSTIKITGVTTSSKSIDISGAGSLYNVWCAGAGLGNLAILSACTISNDLKFDAGWRELTLNGGVLTLNGTLSVLATTVPLLIRNSTIGAQGSIGRASGLLSMNRVAIRDVAFSGGAQFIDTSGYDLGNNSGINVIPPPSQLAAYQPGII